MLRRLLRRVFALLLWPIVAGYMLMTGLLWPALHPLIVAVARLPMFGHVANWLRRLPPYPAMLLFLLPLLILEPLKFFAVYWAAVGHWLSGTAGLLTLHGLTLLSTERLFAVLQPTLLTLPWFAFLWGRITAIRDRLLQWLRSTPAWTEVQRMGAWLRGLMHHLAAWLREEFQRR